MHIRPKNWDAFQHYKDRSPPWIKLHKGLLDDFEFQSLPVASRALAPMLWLLASEDAAGLIHADHQKLAFRLRLTVTEVAEALKPLISGGFFVEIKPASGALAETERAARPETEAEAQEQAEGKELSAGADLLGLGPSFADFWKEYPTDRNMSRKVAQQRWDRLAPEKRAAALAAVPGFRAYCAANSWYRPLHAERFLSQERFEGYAAAPPAVGQPDETAARAAWGGEASKLIDALGDKGHGLFVAWFYDAEFKPGPVPRITVHKPYVKNQIDRKYLPALRRAFGDFQIEVAA